jgi:hypothetical protein
MKLIEISQEEFYQVVVDTGYDQTTGEPNKNVEFTGAFSQRLDGTIVIHTTGGVTLEDK